MNKEIMNVPDGVKGVLQEKGLFEEQIGGTTSNMAEEAAEEEEVPAEDLITDEENPINEMTQPQIEAMLKACADTVKMFEESWNITRKEFKLTDTHMKSLYDYNMKHATPMPENLTDDERDKWDHFNGLNDIPQEAVIEIFGNDHPIHGIQMDQTRDRIKLAIQDFFNWLTAKREYTDIYNAYMELIELQEETEIKKLKLIAEKETDPEKKGKMEDAIWNYYYQKNLGFLADVSDEEYIERTVRNFYDSKKLEYYIQRSQDKLKQLNISTAFILEISGFEKRFLEEKYHKLSNILLLHFMQKIIFTNLGDKKNIERTQIVAMVMALDALIGNRMSEDRKNIILLNIRKFEDNFIDRIEDKETETQE